MAQKIIYCQNFKINIMQIKKYPNKNLNKNRILFFQIGLSLVLCISFISLEWKSYGKSYEPETVDPGDDFTEQAIVIEIPKVKPEPIEKKKVEKIKKEPEPVEPNDDPDQIFDEPEPEPNPDPNEILTGLEKPIPDPIILVSSKVVEKFPVFPGCEIYEDREKLKDCMSKKIYKLIGKHFDTGIASDLNLNGSQQIYTTFKVSHTGQVIFKEARAPHPELQKEAERVILKIPQIKPGKMGGKPVDVLFSVPIRFEVN
jgi:protein TonB